MHPLLCTATLGCDAKDHSLETGRLGRLGFNIKNGKIEIQELPVSIPQSGNVVHSKHNSMYILPVHV